MLTAVLLASLPTVLVVSDRGNDEAPGTERAPIRTLERMRERVAERRAAGDLEPLTVVLRGRFYLQEPLKLGPEFSRVSLVGRGAILDGGRRLAPGREGKYLGRSVQVFDVPTDRRIRQLFTSDRRLPRARTPNAGYHQLGGLLAGEENAPWNQGQDAAKWTLSGLTSSDLPSVEFVAHHYWIQSRMGIREAKAGVIRFDRKSVFRLTDDYTGGGAPFRLENDPRGLISPGSWYQDVPRGKVYVVPAPGTGDVWVGGPATLLEVEGARDLTLQNIAFQHTEWELPSDRAGDPQAAISTPAAIHLKDVVRCRLEKLELVHLGGYAIELSGQSKDNAILRCKMTDLGGGGVKIGHGTERTRLEDSTITSGGRVFAPAVGVWVGDSGGNRILHNEIRDFYYTGISVGWTWGYAPTQTRDNLIEANLIQDIGQGELSDMGGIYTLGTAPGTVIRRNRIENVEARGYGGWGIYLDEGSTHILVEENLVRNVKTGSFHQHYGRENRIENNVFLDARTAGQVIRSRVEEHLSFTMARNVIEWSGTPLLGGNWGDDQVRFTDNLVFRRDGPAGAPAGNREADPKLVVDRKGVRFGKDSPAPEMGIRPLNLEDVGPRKGKSR